MDICKASVVLRLANTSASESSALAKVAVLVPSVSVPSTPVSSTSEVSSVELSVSPLFGSSSHQGRFVSSLESVVVVSGSTVSDGAVELDVPSPGTTTAIGLTRHPVFAP